MPSVGKIQQLGRNMYESLGTKMMKVLALCSSYLIVSCGLTNYHIKQPLMYLIVECL